MSGELGEAHADVQTTLIAIAGHNGRSTAG